MINPNVMYSVTGRYVDGNKVLGYHLVGDDGSQSRETRERIIWLIGKGIISNMRTQVDEDGNILIRGKGVNLNTLPKFDVAKQKYSNSNISQEVANSKVDISKSTVDNIDKMGQYKILRRIMYKNNCLGYEVQDYSGKITKMKRDNVINFAMQKLICNAEARKYIDSGSNTPKITLRGVGCELSKLPFLIVTDKGEIVDPAKETDKFTVRGAYMKCGGIIKQVSTGKTKAFRNGDFIVCKLNGDINILSRIEMESKYTIKNDESKAACDDYLYNMGSYQIELFGNKPINLTGDMVKSWTIFKPKSN